MLKITKVMSAIFSDLQLLSLKDYQIQSKSAHLHAIKNLPSRLKFCSFFIFNPPYLVLWLVMKLKFLTHIIIISSITLITLIQTASKSPAAICK